MLDPTGQKALWSIPKGEGHVSTNSPSSGHDKLPRNNRVVSSRFEGMRGRGDCKGVAVRRVDGNRPDNPCCHYIWIWSMSAISKSYLERMGRKEDRVKEKEARQSGRCMHQSPKQYPARNPGIWEAGGEEFGGDGAVTGSGWRTWRGRAVKGTN